MYIGAHFSFDSSQLHASACLYSFSLTAPRAALYLLSSSPFMRMVSSDSQLTLFALFSTLSAFAQVKQRERKEVSPTGTTLYCRGTRRSLWRLPGCLKSLQGSPLSNLMAEPGQSRIYASSHPLFPCSKWQFWNINLFTSVLFLCRAESQYVFMDVAHSMIIWGRLHQ